MFHVVDDEKTLGELMVEILYSAGHQAIAYSNPITYLNEVYSNNYLSPAAIITDVQMPEMNGYDLIDKIREKFSNQRFVVVSGFNEDDKTSLDHISHFLPKPFSTDELIAIVNTLADRKISG